MQSILNAYKEYADGKRAIVFCMSIPHAEYVAETFSNHGAPAAAMLASTSIPLRKHVIDQWDGGEIKVLCVVNMFITEEFPGAPADAVIVAQPTGSYLRHTARLALARKPESVVLDMAGDILRHGIPEWFSGRVFVPADPFSCLTP